MKTETIEEKLRRKGVDVETLKQRSRKRITKTERVEEVDFFRKRFPPSKKN